MSISPSLIQADSSDTLKTQITHFFMAGEGAVSSLFFYVENDG